EVERHTRHKEERGSCNPNETKPRERTQELARAFGKPAAAREPDRAKTGRERRPVARRLAGEGRAPVDGEHHPRETEHAAHEPRDGCRPRDSPHIVGCPHAQFYVAAPARE